MKTPVAIAQVLKNSQSLLSKDCYKDQWVQTINTSATLTAGSTFHSGLSKNGIIYHKK